MLVMWYPGDRKQEQDLTVLILLWCWKQVRVAFWIGRESGDWKHLLSGRHFRAGMLG